MEDLIHNFGIDWKLLLAQAINFFILLALLRKFAYGPILAMLAKRKTRIEEGISFAKKAEEKLQQSNQERKSVLKKAHEDALAVVAASEEIAKQRKAEILAESNKKGELMIADAQRLLDEEKNKMGEEIYKEAKDLVYLATTRVLGKMPSHERDLGFIEEAMRELKAIKP